MYEGKYMEKYNNNINPAINPIAARKLINGKVLMDRTIISNKTVTEEQKLNIKPLFS